ncbi:hypothetical protein PENTCL1PPCAC_14008, partial [Pristionchus entomophagus]
LFSLLVGSHAQNIFQISHLIQEQNEWISQIRLIEPDQFFSFDDFLDVVDAEGVDSLSSDCVEDLRALIAAKL